MTTSAAFPEKLAGYSPELHHTGILVRDIPSSAQRLVSSFGYRVESEISEDPMQTALVQFLRLPGGTSWLELVSPASPESKLAGALKKGGGHHHICLEVDLLDVFSKKLRQEGWLPVSPAVPAVAFPGRRIAWFMNSDRLLIELLERSDGIRSIASLFNPRKEMK